MRGRCLYPDTKEKPGDCYWRDQRGWRAETELTERDRGVFFIRFCISENVLSLSLSLSLSISLSLSLSLSLCVCCMGQQGCEWTVSHAVLLTFCQVSSYAPPPPTPTPPPPSCHSYQLHFYAYQSPAFLLSITPHLSTDVCPFLFKLDLSDYLLFRSWIQQRALVWTHVVSAQSCEWISEWYVLCFFLPWVLVWNGFRECCQKNKHWLHSFLSTSSQAPLSPLGNFLAYCVPSSWCCRHLGSLHHISLPLLYVDHHYLWLVCHHHLIWIWKFHRILSCSFSTTCLPFDLGTSCPYSVQYVA